MDNNIQFDSTPFTVTAQAFLFALYSFHDIVYVTHA